MGIKDLPLHSCCVHSMSFSTVSRQAETSETIVGFCVDVADGLPPHSQLCHKVSQIEHLAPAHGSSLTGSPAASTSAASAAQEKHRKMWKLVNKVYKPKGMCTSCYERKAWMRKRPCCNCVSWKWAVVPCPAGHPLGVVEEGVIPEDRGQALTGLRRLRRTSYLPLIVRDSSGRFQRIASEHTSGQTP